MGNLTSSLGSLGLGLQQQNGGQHPQQPPGPPPPMPSQQSQAELSQSWMPNGQPDGMMFYQGHGGGPGGVDRTWGDGTR